MDLKYLVDQVYARGQQCLLCLNRFQENYSIKHNSALPDFKPSHSSIVTQGGDVLTELCTNSGRA